MTAAEAADILKRCSIIDLVKLVAIKAAAEAESGGAHSQSYECAVRVNDGATMVARVRITKKRPSRKAGLAP